MKHLMYPCLIILIIISFTAKLSAQDTIFIRIGVNCSGTGTVFSSTTPVLENSVYTINEWELPPGYSSAQVLYDALVGSDFFLEEGSINENIRIDWVIWNLDCSGGSYVPLPNGAKLIFNGYYIVYTNDGSGNWNPVMTNYYFLNNKNAVIRLKNSQNFQDFRLSAGIYTSNLLFFYSGSSYDTTGLQLIIPDDTTDVNLYWTLKANHFSNILGGERDKILVGIEDQPRNVPDDLILKQNYPNPFNQSTIIEFSLPEKLFVELNVYNILGMKTATLLRELKDAGKYNISFNAAGLPSGFYIYEINCGGTLLSRKMLYLK